MAQKKPAAAATARVAEATIYVGPPLAGGKLAKFTIFKDGKLLPHVHELAEKHRCVRDLIVPVSKLSEVQKRLADASSVEALRYAEARQLKKDGVTE